MQNSWSSNVIEFTPSIISESDRIIQGIASAPIYDRMNELITKEALEKALPGFMVIPALTVQHKEFIAGLVQDAWFDESDRLCIKAKLKKTREVDKVWDLVKKGVLNSFSISGVRHSTSCVVNGTPCVTTDIDLNAITLCGDNRVNPQATFDISKAIFGDESDMTDEIKPDMQKAESTPAQEQPVNYTEFAKSFIAELQEAGVIAKKACEEEDKEKEKKEEKDDKMEKAFEELKKSFEELSSKYESLSSTVNDIVNNPMRKSFGFTIKDGQIVSVPIVENDLAKAQPEEVKETISAKDAYRDALMKMRLQ